MSSNLITQMMLSPTSVTFDVEQFDAAIQDHGPRMLHYRAMRSPGGLVDKYDSRRPGEDHIGASNGMVYTKAGYFQCLFTSNNKDTKTQESLLDSANAQITPTRFYECGKPVYLAPFDRLYLAEDSLLVTNWQLVEAHSSGRDRLKFQAVEVQDLIDANGFSYTSGSDFCVEGGQIVWSGQRRPGVDPETGKGRIYSVRYLYRPYFYIVNLGHDIRFTQQEDVMTGVKTTVRLPQQAYIQREYVFENTDVDDQSKIPNDPRQVQGPADGSFGAR